MSEEMSDVIRAIRTIESGLGVILAVTERMETERAWSESVYMKGVAEGLRKAHRYVELTR